MLSREAALGVASGFVAYYYNEFVRHNAMVNLHDLYAETSSVLLADLNTEQPVVVQGKRDITLHLAKLDSQLGQRKVEIVSVDYIPLTGGSVQVICQGVLYLRGYRNAFFHIFVLVPTQYRPNTFFIASDYLRFVNSDEEVIPPGVVVLNPDQVASYLAEENSRREEELKRQLFLDFQQRIRRQAEEAAAAAASEPSGRRMEIPAPASRQHQERRDVRQQPNGAASFHTNAPPRDFREQRDRHDPRDQRELRDRRELTERRERNKDYKTNEDRFDGNRLRKGPERPEVNRERKRPPRDSAKRDEKLTDNTITEEKGSQLNRKPRETRKPASDSNENTKPAEPQKDAVKEKKPPSKRVGPSTCVRLVNVPKHIKLSEIKAHLTSLVGEPEDVYWFGQESAHAVVKMKTEDMAAKLCASEGITIANETVKAVLFYR